MASFLQLLSLIVFVFRTRSQEFALDAFDNAQTNGYYNAPGKPNGLEDGICIKRIGDPMSFEECAQACLDHIDVADDNECGGFEVYTRNNANHCYIFLKSIADLQSECIFYRNDYCQKHDLISSVDPDTCASDEDCPTGLVCCKGPRKFCHPPPAAKSIIEAAVIPDAIHAKETLFKYDKNVYGYILLIGFIAFILINNVFIGCWCVRKKGQSDLQYEKCEVEVVNH
eukprot:306209_1